MQAAAIPEQPAVAILCGGRGTRLTEHTEAIPKPLVEIGGRPILWHVMQIYASQGFRHFALCLGYKGDQIERFIAEEPLAGRAWRSRAWTPASTRRPGGA